MLPTRALRMFQPTRRMRFPVPAEDQAAHGVSQRLRKMKNIPPELVPLGVVVAFALAAAIYSSARHLMIDKTLRLQRQNRGKEEGHGSEGEHH